MSAEDTETLFDAPPLPEQERMVEAILFASAEPVTLREMAGRGLSHLIGNQICEERERLPAPEPFNVYQANVAYVGDGSHYGATSPLMGYRYRFQLERTFGAFGFYGALADYRRYHFRKPFSFAPQASQSAGCARTGAAPHSDCFSPRTAR